MNAYTVPSPIQGMPDYTVNLPAKPVRLHLTPHQALVLYVLLEQNTSMLNKADAPDDLVEILAQITDKLHDRLEVTFHEHNRP